ncbi:hypothetical protein IWZ00DRAFT_546726 [Phyllosticta capitalensis]
MLPHRTNNGVVKAALSKASHPPAYTRSIGGWGRNRWPRWKADPFNEEWRHFERRMDAFRREVDKDPYEAIFGWSNRLREGESSSQSPILRPCRRTLPVGGVSAQIVDGTEQSPLTPAKDRTDAAPIPTQQASSYPHVIPFESETVATSRLEYDPISGRMVEKSSKDVQPGEAAAQDGLSKASSISSPQETGSAAAENQNEPCASYDASKDYRDPRDDALNAFDAKQKKTPAPRFEDWYARQGLDPPPPREESEPKRRSVSAPWYKPEHDPEKPFTPAESVETPFGRIRRNKLPEDDIDLLTADDIRSRMGRRRTKEDTRDDVEVQRLAQDFERIRKADSFEDEDGSKIELPVRRTSSQDVAQESAQKTSQKPTRQPTAESPGLETALSRHVNRASFDDGYSKDPIGLQTSYLREKESGRDLAADISAKEVPEQYDDGYSRKPTGLQTSFERERMSGQSLESELQAKAEPELMDDGYSKDPMGLETSYQRELASGKSLEEELRARGEAEAMPDDGYSKDPTGLQSSYTRETEAVRNGEKKSLAEELEEAPIGAGFYSNVCSDKFATPKSVEQRRKESSPEVVKDWYGYSLQPLDLETSHELELEERHTNQRKRVGHENSKDASKPFKDTSSVTPKQTSSTGAQDAKTPSPLEAKKALDNVNGLFNDVSLSRAIREIYEKHYGKITYDHRQPATPLPASAHPENEGRLDESIHQSLVDHEAKNPNKYKFKPDNLEAELAARNRAVKEVPIKETREEKLAETLNTAQAAAPLSSESSNSKTQVRHYKLLAYDRSSRTVETSETTSTVKSSGEMPVSLSVALSKLANPVKFLPHLKQLGKEGYEPVASTADLLVLRLRDGHAAPSDAARSKPLRANPVDGTTIPLPPTPTTMSPTGYVNLDPVVDQPDSRSAASETNRASFDDGDAAFRSAPSGHHHAHRSGKKVRRTEAVFTGQQRAKAEQEKRNRRQGVRTVLTTLIWATATCYIAGVAGEVAKGY